jgi:hypothetical protein
MKNLGKLVFIIMILLGFVSIYTKHHKNDSKNNTSESVKK